MNPVDSPQVAERLIPSFAAEATGTALPPPSPPSGFVRRGVGEALQRDWTQTRWAQNALRRELVCTTCMWGLTLLIWISALTVPKRLPLAFEAPLSLRDATAKWAAADMKPNYDQLVLFLRSTLPVLYEFTPDGSPFRQELQGIVAPKIIDNVSTYFTHERKLIHSEGIRQSFRLDPIQNSDIFFDAPSNRVAVAVHGTFEVTVDAPPAGKMVRIPFHARVVLSPNRPSQVNPFLFFMEAIELDEGSAGK